MSRLPPEGINALDGEASPTSTIPSPDYRPAPILSEGQAVFWRYSAGKSCIVDGVNIRNLFGITAFLLGRWFLCYQSIRSPSRDELSYGRRRPA